MQVKFHFCTIHFFFLVIFMNFYSYHTNTIAFYPRFSAAFNIFEIYNLRWYYLYFTIKRDSRKIRRKNVVYLKKIVTILLFPFFAFFL